MNVCFLGTNGWYDSITGHTVCILVETDNAIVVLDAGSGLYKAQRYFTYEKPVHLFLSHLHLDHIIGLHVLNKFLLPQGLTIHCGQGMSEYLKAIIAAPYSMPLKDLAYRVRINELEDDLYSADGFKVSCAQMVHSVPTIGFRFEADGKSLAYCPDTGYCENAIRLAKRVDFLITECAFRTGEKDDHWPHLNPETAAMLACEAEVKQLALVHFDAYRYPDLQSRKIAESVAQSIFTHSMITTDDQCFEI